MKRLVMICSLLSYPQHSLCDVWQMPASFVPMGKKIGPWRKRYTGYKRVYRKILQWHCSRTPNRCVPLCLETRLYWQNSVFEFTKDCALKPLRWTWPHTPPFNQESQNLQHWLQSAQRKRNWYLTVLVRIPLENTLHRPFMENSLLES